MKDIKNCQLSDSFFIFEIKLCTLYSQSVDKCKLLYNIFSYFTLCCNLLTTLLFPLYNISIFLTLAQERRPMLISKLQLIMSVPLIVVMYVPYFVHASSSSIIISEIAAYESNSTSSTEWIELYNRSPQPINIEGWKFVETSGSSHISHGITGNSYIIQPNSFAIIANNADVFLTLHREVSVPVFDSSWGLLNETGEYIALVSQNGTIIEEFTYITASSTSLERINLLSDDYSPANWREHISHHSAGIGNSLSKVIQTSVIEPTILEVLPEISNISTTTTPTILAESGGGVLEDIPEITEFTNYATTTEYVANTSQTSNETVAVSETNNTTSTPSSIPLWGAIRINELVSDPVLYDTEWIELYNTTNFPIDMSLWKLVDGSNKNHFLSGILPSGEFIIINNLKFALNNSGDTITLISSNNTIIDTMKYGISESSAQIPTKSMSIARRYDGVSTGIDKNDFALTLTKTPGFANRIFIPPTPEPTIQKTASTQSITTNITAEKIIPQEEKLLINELFPNPDGADTENEFIELFNPQDRAINLKNWTIEDGSHTRYQFHSELIEPRAYYVLTRAKSSISLNNSGTETITLTDPFHRVIDEVSYTQKVGKDWSYGRMTNEWSWSLKSTPLLQNVALKPNQKPDAVLFSESGEEIEQRATVMFDASDSIDSDGDTLLYQWSFGDRTRRIYSSSSTITHAFQSAGTYTIRVAITDSKATSTAHVIISVLPPFNEDEVESIPTNESNTTSTTLAKIIPISTPTKIKKTISTAKKLTLRTATLSEIEHRKENEKVVLQGIVLVEPGILGANVFYIGNPGVEIYQHQKKFPQLSRGDLVSIKGVISRPQSGIRIKVSKITDIHIISQGNVVSTTPFRTISFDDSQIHDLVTISGTVETVGSNMIRLTYEGKKLSIALKFNPLLSDLPSENDELRVTGVLTKSKNNFVLLPRGIDDIEILEHTSSTSTDDTFTTSSHRTTSPISSTLPALLGATVSCALAFLWQQRTSAIS